MGSYTFANMPSPLKLLSTVVVFVAAGIYGFITLSSEDPLWFVPWFDDMPVDVQVYCRGEVTTLPGNDPQAIELATLFNEQMSGQKRWDSISMSDETFEYYQTDTERVVAVVFWYNPTARVHSSFKYFTNVDMMLVPLDGRHAEKHAVFGRLNDNMIPGMIEIGDPDPMREYVFASGLCSPNN